MKRVWLLAIFLIVTVSAACENGQININNATVSDLDKLYGIGPAKAEAILNARPFDSLDDLIDVNGIGEVTLANIKSQGLACVEEEVDKIKKEKVNNEEKEDKEINIAGDEILDENNIQEETKEIETIKLVPKNIKTSGSKFELGKLPTYGLLAFSVLLGLLFLIRRKKYKNEFE